MNPSSSTQQQFEPPLSVIHKKRRRSSSNIHTSTSFTKTNTTSNTQSNGTSASISSSQLPKGHNKNDNSNTSSSTTTLNWENINNDNQNNNNPQQTQPQDQNVQEQIVLNSTTFKKSRKSFTIQEKLNHVFQYKQYLQRTNNNQRNEQKHKNMAAWLRNHNRENGTNIGRSTFYKWYQTFDHEVQITNVENACSISNNNCSYKNGRASNKNNQGVHVVGNMNGERKSSTKNQEHSKPIEKTGGHYKKRLRIRPYHGMCVFCCTLYIFHDCMTYFFCPLLNIIEMESILIQILQVRNKRLLSQNKPMSTPGKTQTHDKSRSITLYEDKTGNNDFELLFLVSFQI